MDSQTKKTSKVWVYFIQLNEKTFAECKLCKNAGKSETDCRIPRNDGTTNLWKHLKANHSVEYRALEKSKTIYFL